MTVLPVIERELRAEARHVFTYWLRVLGASVSLIILSAMMIAAPDPASGLGSKLFGNLNTALFITLWLLVPLLTADCLSRERREGTLGILFLTPLTARAIVIGKGLIHSLRALTLVLAALPVLAIPLLFGGVTWREELMALLLDLSSVALALAAGMVASAYCRQWNRALLLAEVLAGIALLGFVILLSLALIAQVVIPYVPGAGREIRLGEIIAGGAVCTDAGGMWSDAMKFLPIAATRAWLAVVCEMFVVAVLLLGLSVLWVARRVERTRQERPATTRQLLWRSYLFAPRFWKSLFRSKMRRRLDRNPIGWLQQYSTAGRMTHWGWCLFIVIAECVLLTSASSYDLEWPQYWLLLLLEFSLAASAAGSFRRERETGALELILVTPLRELEIITGRLFGLWKQFLPALGIVLSVLAFPVYIGPLDHWYWDSYLERDLAVSAQVACTFATLPVVGLYFSLLFKHFLTAWLSTLGLCVLLPIMLVQVITVAGGRLENAFWPGADSFANFPVLTSGFQTMLALIAVTRLYWNLQERKFAFAP